MTKEKLIKNILEKNVSKLSIYLSKYEIFMNYILKEYNSLINKN